MTQPTAANPPPEPAPGGPVDAAALADDPGSAPVPLGQDLPDGAVPPGLAQKQLSGRLGRMSLPRQVLTLAMWPFLEQLLNFLVGFVDMALAGRLPGELTVLAAVDAIAIAAFIGWFAGLMFGAVGTGATALIARAIGGRHKSLANAGLGQAVLVGLGMGVLGLGLMLALGDTVARLFIRAQPQRPEVAALARAFCAEYLYIFGLGLPAASILFIGNAALRGAGDTRSPFMAMCLVNAVNLVASFYLALNEEALRALGAPFPGAGAGLGVVGIAWGTTIAWCVGCAAVLLILAKGRAPIRLRWIRLRPHWHTMRRIVRVGLPAMLESGGVWVINGAIVKIVSMLPGVGVLGAHMIGIRIEAISFLPGFAIGIAASTLAGQYLGLGDPARAKRAVELCFLGAAVMMGSMGVVFMLMPQTLVGLVSPDSTQHLTLAPMLLIICGVIQPFFAMTMVFGQALRGTGDTKAAMMISYGSMLTVRLGGALVLGLVLGWGLWGVWIALCACLAVRGLAFAARFYQGRWQQIQV